MEPEKKEKEPVVEKKKQQVSILRIIWYLFNVYCLFFFIFNNYRFVPSAWRGFLEDSSRMYFSGW